MGKEEVLKPIYLSDLAIEQIEEDEFKHAEIAEVIKQIVLECPMPFTIGLFGSWGTGKTTVSNFLRKSLLNIKNIAVITFDVWKFEQDSLRRQFLIAVEKQLKEYGKLAEDFELDKRLFCKVSEKIDTQVNFDIKKALRTSWIYFLAAAIFVGVWLYSRNAIQAFGFSLFTSVILEILKAVSKSTNIDTTTFEQDQLNQPDEFERQFERIIKEARQVERFIILIDNLDRCEHKKTTELLSTVKTFLEKSKCIYVVQCDEKAIKDHLKKVYEEIDPDEYLRKFFNTVINIPNFIRSDLDNYTEKLLKKTNIHAFADTKVSSIITTAFRENPRRIKQFINMLISHFLLAHKRESEESKGLYPEGVITKSIPFLAKFLILRHNWPDFFEIIEDDPMILEEINLSYRDSKINLSDKAKKMLSNDKKLDDFLRGTQLITSKYIRAFLYLKQSEEELKIPESEDIRIALLDGKQSLIEEKFETIKTSKDLIIAYEKILLDLLEKYIERPERLFNIISISLKSSRQAGVKFSQNLYDKVVDILNSKLQEHFHRFDPEDVFLAMEQCSAALRFPILENYSKLLSTSKSQGMDEFFGNLDLNKFQRSLIRQIAGHLSWFESKKTDLQNTIAKSYTIDLDIIESFCGDKNLVNFFLSEAALNKIIEQISDSDVQDLKEGETLKLLQKVKILKAASELMVSALKNTLLAKLSELSRNINSRPFGESKRQFLRLSCEILVDFDFTAPDLETERNNFSKELYNGFTSARQEQVKVEYVIPMMFLESITDSSFKTNLINSINPFLNNCAPNSVIQLISDLKKYNSNSYIEEKYKALFFARTLQSPEIFEVLWENIKPEVKDELFVNMMGSGNYMYALNKIKSIGYKVFNSEIVSKAILGRIVNINPTERVEFYNALIALKSIDNKEILDKFTSQIKLDLSSNNLANEQAGFLGLQEGKINKFLSLEDCKSIINDLIEILDRRDSLAQNNNSVLEAIVFLWDDLSLTHKDKFITLIVYKLFEKNKDIETRKLALSKLSKCKPEYSQYKSHLDHLLSLIEQAGDTNNKNILAADLLICKPESGKIKTEEERKFWEAVQKNISQVS